MIGLVLRIVDEVLGAIMIISAPNTFQIARVPVPSFLNGTAQLAYSVTVSAPAVLVGRPNGLVRSEPANSKRYVLVALRFAPNAAAGPVVVARVRFGTGQDTWIVPVIANIAPSRRIVLRPDAEMCAAGHGDLVAVRYTLKNAGNAPDTVVLRVTPPPGWEVKQHARAIVLAAGASAIRSVSLRVPRGGASGDFAVSASAVAGDGERARSTSTVSVLDTRSIDIRQGPVLTTAVTTITGGAPVRPVLSVTASGEISDNVRLDAQYTVYDVNDPASERGLLRLGTYRTPFFASLVAPSWRIGLGTTGAAFSDLTGITASGQGVSLQSTQGRSTLSVLAAVNTFADQTRGASLGSSTGARYQIATENAATFISAVHITSGGGDLSRELNAFGVGLSTGLRAKGNLTSELALRQYEGGGGLGWNLHARREGDTLSYDFQVIHAPGGSAAFAAAADRVNGTVARRLTSWMRVFANAWTSADNSPPLGSLDSYGWMVSPQLQIAEATFLDFDVHATSFATIEAFPQTDARNSVPSHVRVDSGGVRSASFNTGFATNETGAGATLRSQRGAIYSSANFTLASVERTTDVVGRHFAQFTPRATLQGILGFATETGSVEATINGDVERGNSENASSLVSVRADRISLPGSPGWLLLNAESQRIKSSSLAHAVVSYRFGIEAVLGNAYALHVEAERNPYYLTAQGRSPLLFAIKVERSLRLPMLRRGGTTGHVFQDLNGNGVRDPGEPGMPNVVVHIGGETSVTDANGSYTIFARTSERPAIDLRSVPLGWALETDAVNDLPNGDVPIVAHTSAKVMLIVMADALGNVPSVDWSRVDVFARDVRGREWLARLSGAGAYRFDALPPGDYVLRVDATHIDQPLLLRGEPTLTVGGQDATGHVTLPLYPRSVRVWRGGIRGAAIPDSLSSQPIPRPDR